MEEALVIHTDGGARGNPGPAAAAFVIEHRGRVLHSDSKFLGNATNNFSEYQGVLLALGWILANRSKIPSAPLIFYLDSELIVRQLMGVYKVKDENLRKLFLEVNSLIKQLKTKAVFNSVPRSKNKVADFLVNQELDKNI